MSSIDTYFLSNATFVKTQKFSSPKVSANFWGVLTPHKKSVGVELKCAFSRRGPYGPFLDWRSARDSAAVSRHSRRKSGVLTFRKKWKTPNFNREVALWNPRRQCDDSCLIFWKFVTPRVYWASSIHVGKFCSRKTCDMRSSRWMSTMNFGGYLFSQVSKLVTHTAFRARTS